MAAASNGKTSSFDNSIKADRRPIGDWLFAHLALGILSKGHLTRCALISDQE